MSAFVAVCPSSPDGKAHSIVHAPGNVDQGERAILFCRHCGEAHSVITILAGGTGETSLGDVRVSVDGAPSA